MKLAILGASKPHLKLFLKAKEMGIETYCVAWDKDAYCKNFADHFCDISIIDKEAVADMCIKEKIDGIISNALEIAVPTIAYVSEKCGLNGISQASSEKARNKYKMRRCIQEHNACPQPNYHLLKNDNTFRPQTFPIIVKPTDSSSSKGVTKITKIEEYDIALKRALEASKQKEVLIEEFIDGREISVETISYHGVHYILTITDKETTGAPYFVETAHHQPTTLDTTLQNKIHIYVRNILNALKIDEGASHAEFKIDHSGNVFFIEIGARGGGDFISYNLVELSTGYDYIKGMIEVALDIFKKPSIKKQSCAGVYFLSKNTSYIKDFIDKNKHEKWVIDYNIENKPLITLTKSQDRTGYIIYQSDHRINVK